MKTGKFLIVLIISGFLLAVSTRFANAFGLGGLFDSASLVSVPDPSTMLLLGFGLIGLAGIGSRKFKK